MATLDEKLGRDKRFSFTSHAVAVDTFAVVDLQGFEAISKPYVFTLTLVSERADLDLDELLAKPAKLAIYSRLPGQPPVLYHGVLTEFTQLQQISNGWTFYQATLAPRMQRLALHQYSEVYLQPDVPHVVETVLKQAQLTLADYEFRLLRRDYKVLPFVCQFDETYLNFIHRWMEWRGIYYFFEQGPDREKLVFADTRTIHTAARGVVSYRPAEQLDTGARDESVQAFICTQRPMPRKVGVKEYDYHVASMELVGEAEVSSKGEGEIWHYGEHWWTQEWSAKLAELRAQELACRAKVFHGESTATGLKAGYLLDLTGHYRGDFNGQYLITEVRHEGSQAGTLLAGLGAAAGAVSQPREDHYRTTFAAIPGALQFRPERTTPRPKIHGLINAFIDAEGSGEYAEIDDQGRYKVQVPFDKTEKAAGKSSFWIRKASQYSGKDHGLHYPLHKGAEVLLGFENGDPDRPVIMGTVSNSEHPNVVTRDNQTQMVLHTAGGNRMQFEDLLDREYLHFSTPKAGTTLRMGTGPQSTVGAQAASNGTAFTGQDGFTFKTDANWNETVGGKKEATITGNTTTEIDGAYQETIKGQRNCTWGTPGLAASEAGQFIPGVSAVGPHVKSVAAHFQTTNQEMIWGGHSQTVMGNMSRTAIGTAHTDTYVAAGTTHLYVGGLLNVGAIQVQSFGQYLGAMAQKIQALGSKVESIATKIGVAATRIAAGNSRVEAYDLSAEMIEMNAQLAAMRLASMGTEVTDRSVGVSNSGVVVDESGSRVTRSLGVAIQDAPIMVNDAGVAFLG
ncbi:MAG: type VI secretion system tip protein VgrG [Nitrospira sp.]|nr:type VI secretion system tip protein VgrG [Nitrospira sp.]